MGGWDRPAERFQPRPASLPRVPPPHPRPLVAGWGTGKRAVPAPSRPTAPMLLEPRAISVASSSACGSLALENLMACFTAACPQCLST